MSLTPVFTKQLMNIPCIHNCKSKAAEMARTHSRRDPNDLVNEFALYYPPHGHSRRGGHKRLYHQYLARVLNPEFQLTPAELRLAAQDRGNWRKSLVAACKYQPP